MKITKKGISLIVLVITIIVVIILAGAVILSLSKNNPITQASKATYLSDLRNFQTELDLYETKQFSDKLGKYDPKLLQADETSVTYDGIVDNTKTMNDLIPTLGKATQYAGQFQVVDGKLVFQGSDTNKQNWAREAGYEVVIVGEPKVTIVPPLETVVVQGTDIIYTVKVTSNAPLTTVDLTGKVEVLDNNGVALVTQPDITIGTVSGISSDATRQVDVTIKTNTLANGAYKLKVKSGVVTNSNSISNTTDTISLVGFDIDNNPPENPVMSATPSEWTNGNVTVSITYSSDSIVKEYSLDSTNWSSYTSPVVTDTNNTTVYARGKDAAGNISGVTTLTVANIDKINPRITAAQSDTTSSSITVVANASDAESGIDAASYEYSKDNGATWTAATNQTSYTFTELSTGTYNCKVKVVDKTGNTSTSSVVSIATQGLGNVTMSANPTSSTNGNVTVTIVYPTGIVTKQYSTDGTNWNTYTTQVVISENNTTVYAKGLDDVGNQTAQATLTISNIDRVAPTNPVMSANPTTWTNGNVTVTITYSEDSSIKEYSLNGTTWSAYTTGVTVTTNNTTVYARGKDLSGNMSGQSTLTVTNIDKTAPTVAYGTNGGSGEIASTTVTVSDVESNVNINTLQYVWDTQNTATPGSGWISFTNGAILTKGSVNGTYYLWIKASDNAGNIIVSKTNAFILTQPVAVNKPVLAAGMTAKKWNGSLWNTVTNPSTDTTWYNYGTKQWANAQTADGSMWVWIPRYEYKIPTPHISTAQTIEINFINGIGTTATSGYTVHPAFTFGSTELTGIWIAKFEASGSTTAIDIKPGVSSLINITIDSIFTACRNMETTYGTRYGWGTTGTGIDTHLMKNTEWGAVAYLSHSIYGKNSEVWNNPNKNYITGQSGYKLNASSTTSTYSYDNLTYGINASTTGNIYGIYDMSGGASEYTAAYVDNGNFALTTYGLSLINALSQYKDVYTSNGDTESGNYSATSNKKGDAVYETSIFSTAWYNDFSEIPYSNLSFFKRGEFYANTSGAGIFCFEGGMGMADNYVSFRPVLAVSSGL